MEVKKRVITVSEDESSRSANTETRQANKAARRKERFPTKDRESFAKQWEEVPDEEIDANFKVLLQLIDWSEGIQMRLENEGKMSRTAYQKLLNNSVQLSASDVVALLEDFINKRKNAILMKHVPISISPEDLLSKLELDLRSIRSIFDYRVKAIKSENKLIKKASHLIKSEIFEQYLQEREHASRGFLLSTTALDALEPFEEQGTCDYCQRSRRC